MKKYEELEVAVIPFTEEDVITTSGDVPQPCRPDKICCDGTIEIICRTKGLECEAHLQPCNPIACKFQ